MLRCKQVGEDFELSSLFSLPELACPVDWHGTPIDFPFAFYFAVSSEEVFFGAILPSTEKALPSTSFGEFVEGLWEGAVIELFLAEEGTSRYQEINLAPSGAWWSCAFDSYRARASLPPPRSIKIFASPRGEILELGAAIKRNELAIQTGFGERNRANLSAILGSGNNRSYLSLSPSSGEPDFHRVESWSKVRRT